MAQSTKQALLQALSAAEGGYISGQQLAETLGVSRAAIHKAALPSPRRATRWTRPPAGGIGCWAATPSARKQ